MKSLVAIISLAAVFLVAFAWGAGGQPGNSHAADFTATGQTPVSAQVATGEIAVLSLVASVDSSLTSAGDTLWGDIDCSGSVSHVDSLKTLRHDAGLSVTQEPGCFLPGDVIMVGGSARVWGDVDCLGGMKPINPIDSLELLNFDVGLPAGNAECLRIGSSFAVDPTPTPTPTPSPTSTQTAPTPTHTEPTPSPTPSPTLPGVSDIVSDQPGLSDFPTDGKVIATNVGLAISIFVALLFTAILFNQTLANNRQVIDDFVAGILKPFRSLGGPIEPGLRAASGRWPWPWMRQVVGPVVILLLTGLIYTFLSPGIAFDLPTGILFGCLVVSIGVVTYFYSGGQALIARRRFGAQAGVRLYALALAIAVLSVVVSRLIDYKPGFIFGFVATFTLLRPPVLDRKQEGQVVLWPIIALLAISIAAWALIDPVRELKEGSAVRNVAETAAVTVFWAGLQGSFFNMIPITFMDGHKLIRSNRSFWLAIFATSSFLFVATLLNRDKAFVDSLNQMRVWAVLAVLLVSSVFTLLFWLYFAHWRHGRLLPAMPSLPSLPWRRREGP